jgi:hypothetical protein
MMTAGQVRPGGCHLKNQTGIVLKKSRDCGKSVARPGWFYFEAFRLRYPKRRCR